MVASPRVKCFNVEPIVQRKRSVEKELTSCYLRSVERAWSVLWRRSRCALMSRQEYSQRGRLLVAAWVQLLTLIDRIIVLFDERGLMTVDCIIRVDATRAVMREATPSQNKQPAYLQVAQQNRQNDFHLRKRSAEKELTSTMAI